MPQLQDVVTEQLDPAQSTMRLEALQGVSLESLRALLASRHFCAAVFR